MNALDFLADPRGRMRHRACAEQLRDFSGLRWGAITPTDCDGQVEFRDKLFIWFELKLKGQRIAYGQRQAFMRQTRRVAMAGVPAYFIHAEHETPLGEWIRCAETAVAAYYDGTAWFEETESRTLKQFCDALVGKYAPECLSTSDYEYAVMPPENLMSWDNYVQLDPTLRAFVDGEIAQACVELSVLRVENARLRSRVRIQEDLIDRMARRRRT